MKYRREISHVIRSTRINDPRRRIRMTRESTRVATYLSQRNTKITRLDWMSAASKDDPSALYLRDQHQPHLQKQISLQACCYSNWQVCHESSSMSYVYGAVCCRHHTMPVACPRLCAVHCRLCTVHCKLCSRLNCRGQNTSGEILFQSSLAIGQHIWLEAMSSSGNNKPGHNHGIFCIPSGISRILRIWCLCITGQVLNLSSHSHIHTH